MSADTPEGRAAIIERLEADQRARVTAMQRRHAEYEAYMAAVSEVMRVHVEAITAPMRAFADVLRLDIELHERRRR